jgi:hypothetical protein
MLVPVKVALAMATFEFPLLVTVMFRDAVVPTVTLPKLTLEGFTDKVSPAATPMPLKEIEGELGALLTRDRVPVEAPAPLGLNCTLNVLL